MNLQLDLNIAVDNTTISQVSSVRYLGSVVDSSLSWRQQVQAISSKVNRKLHAFRAIRPSLPLFAAKLFYKSVILSDLLYASNCYFAGLSECLKSQLIRLNKACIRCTAGAHRLAHTGPLAATLHLPDLSAIVKNKLLSLIYRCTRGIASSLLSSQVHLVATRHRSTRGAASYLATQPPANSCSGARRPLFLGISLWNDLSSAARSTSSLQEFKSLVRP